MIFQSYGFSTAITIPVTDYSLDLGWFYLLFIVFWLVGFSNAVNLTDGLDGLLSGTAAIAFGALLYWLGIKTNLMLQYFV